ncbi:unnamed protein product [Haemonchus placei]|uniref:Coiled-coil domain-containing protein 43 n=1 Tax=Haemonchus placei TaxID=6290 RepID=A0A0N4VU74_HAEPC|nr:unnamed protein product [Haemonchus placei]
MGEGLLSSVLNSRIQTCIDEDPIEICPTQSDEDDYRMIAEKIWEEAGELDIKAAEQILKEAVEAESPVKEKEGVEPKKAEVDEGKEGGGTEVDGKKASKEVEENDKEGGNQNKTKKKKKKEGPPQDEDELLKKLQETQPDLIEYTSIMGPVNLAEQQGSTKAGSLGDLLNQLSKFKSAREKKEREDLLRAFLEKQAAAKLMQQRQSQQQPPQSPETQERLQVQTGGATTGTTGGKSTAGSFSKLSTQKSSGSSRKKELSPENKVKTQPVNVKKVKEPPKKKLSKERGEKKSGSVRATKAGGQQSKSKKPPSVRKRK